MNSEAIKKHLAEKLERIPEVIQVTIHRHGDLIAEAIELFKAGHISEACDALDEASDAYAEAAAYISYIEGYAESRYDLLQEAADPSPAKERNY